MAFTGAPTVTSLGKRAVRLSGAFSLAAGASGTITANGGGGDAELPATFPALNADHIMIVAHQVAAGAVTPIVIGKNSPFTTITITNSDAGNATGNLEIYVLACHSMAW